MFGKILLLLNSVFEEQTLAVLVLHLHPTVTTLTSCLIYVVSCVAQTSMFAYKLIVFDVAFFIFFILFIYLFIVIPCDAKGIVGRISPKTWAAMDVFLTSISSEEYESMASALITMGATSKNVDAKAFARDLEKIFSSIQASITFAVSRSLYIYLQDGSLDSSNQNYIS